MWTGLVSREVVLHRAGNFVRGAGPDLDEFLTTLGVGDQTPLVLLLDLVRLLLGVRQKLGLGRWRDDVGDGDRHTRARRPVEAECLELVEGLGDLDLGVALGETVDRCTEHLLVHLRVDDRGSPPAAPR